MARHLRTASLLLLGALLLPMVGGCSPRRAVESLLLRGHFARLTDIPFGEHPRHRLDVYRPRSLESPAPVVVFLYGGRWQEGTREDYRLLGDALTRHGLLVVVPDYRLHPEAIFPDWVEDGALAVRWARAHIRGFGGDPDRIFVMGHSAGAHTATLLALDDGFLQAAGVGPHEVAGFVSMAGPVDTEWTDPDVQTLMGPPEGWERTYPANLVGGAAPPILFLHGDEDRTVDVGNSVRLAGRLTDAGACAPLVVYRGIGHVEIIVALSLPRLSIAPVAEDVATFIRRVGASGGERSGC